MKMEQSQTMKTYQETIGTIPAKKRLTKHLQTAAGIVVFIGGFFVPKFLGFPWQFGAAVCGLGLFVASKEVTIAYAKVLVGAIKDLFAVVVNRGGTG